MLRETNIEIEEYNCLPIGICAPGERDEEKQAIEALCYEYKGRVQKRGWWRSRSDANGWMLKSIYNTKELSTR